MDDVVGQYVQTLFDANLSAVDVVPEVLDCGLE